MRRPLLITLLGMIALLGTPAAAQSFNIDFGEADDAPPPTYAAEGRAGVWNGLLAPHPTITHNLIDIEGNTTNVSVRQIGGLDNITVEDPLIGGDDATLMHDFLVTYSAALESCLFFQNLEPGEYEVILYAWMPAAPDVLAYTSCDEEPGFPHYEVGGEWPGRFEPFITHTVHYAEVAATGAAAGNLSLHSGVAPGENPNDGAALNGVQIRKIEPCPWDCAPPGGNDEINFDDLIAVVNAISTQDLDCDVAPDNEDGTFGNGVITFDDLIAVINRPTRSGGLPSPYPAAIL